MIRISPRGFGSNTYVLTEDGVHAIVIDPAQPRVEKELDKLGRICIPKDMRNALGLEREVEIVMTTDGILIQNPGYVLVKKEKDAP